ncbi:hypothetical protein AB205_0166540 [Aquarana catesbeiana]|uniref:Globin domain-containing protein n=1 Tax=Aquarana catesbeiana TaxID=8400 RepID=A0A2G9S4F4_AQUCT|nr:hypothetical protein AB205_0166540 [Aquarana catesbeiana]
MEPQNFSLLSPVILEVLANRFPDDFTPEVQVAWKKFLFQVCAFLTSKAVYSHPA